MTPPPPPEHLSPDDNARREDEDRAWESRVERHDYRPLYVGAPPLLRSIVIACIPLLPAMLGFVLWAAHIHDTVIVNTQLIKDNSARINEIDKDGTRALALTNERIAVLERDNTQQDRRLGQNDMSVVNIGQRLAIIEDRQNSSLLQSRDNGTQIKNLIEALTPHLKAP